MIQTAIFVDAGYLFAQGSTLLTGKKVTRQRLTLNVVAAGELFAKLAEQAAPGVRLLRIYWYDGLLRGGAMTTEHVALGRAANIKLRLGLVNSRGEQKGVDSLIVTDLIELARNEAISDALVLSGDEDIRVGLQVAQTFGVRIQLVGIKPALGSQSPDLVAEADTHVELDEGQITPLLTIARTAPNTVAVTEGGEVARSGSFDEIAGDLAAELIAEAYANRQAVLDYIVTNRGALPSDFDRPSLAKLRDRLGRDVADDERRTFRSLLRAGLRKG